MIAGMGIASGARIGCGRLLTGFIRGSMTQMANGRPQDILKFVVPKRIIAESAEVLRSLSNRRRESVVLWMGTYCDEDALVKRLVVPYQHASARHFDVPLHERLRIARQLASCGEKLLAQLHTHPGKAYHSPIDDRLALPRHTGALSIVVADFAATWDGNMEEVSVNRHLGGGVWEELGDRKFACYLRCADGISRRES